MRTSGPQLVLVSGPLGIGKSTFLDEVLRRLADRAATILADCRPTTRSASGLIAAVDRSLVADGWAGVADGTEESGSRVARADAGHELARRLGEIAVDVPVIVGVDNLEDDPDAAETLEQLMYDLHGPVLILATLREGPRSRSVYDRLADGLGRRGLFRRTVLGPLDDPSCRRLAEWFVGPDVEGRARFLSGIANDAGGNPAMIVELARATEDSGTGRLEGGHEPGALAPLAKRWIGTIGREGRALLEAACIDDVSWELDIVAAVASLDRADALDGLDDVVAAGLIVEDEARAGAPRYRFVHGAIREALCARLSSTHKRYLHECMADSVQVLRPGHPEAARWIARHRCAVATVGADHQAARWALAATAEAANAGDTAGAVEWGQRAVDHAPSADERLRVDAMIALGSAQVVAGVPAGVGNVARGVARAVELGEFAVAARAVHTLVRATEVASPQVEETSRIVRQVLDADEVARRVSGAPFLERTEWAALVVALVRFGVAGDADSDLARRAVPVLRHKARRIVGPDRLHERLTAAEELRAGAELADDGAALVLAHHLEAMAAAVLGEDDRVDRALDLLRQVPPASGDPGIGEFLRERAVSVAVSQGRFDVLDGIASPVMGADEPGMYVPGTMLARTRAVRTWLVAKVQRYRIVVPDDDPYATDLARAERAALTALAGDVAWAASMARDLLRTQRPEDETWLHLMGLLGLAAGEIGDGDLASEVLGQLAPYAALNCGVGYRTFVGPVALHLGRMATITGDWDAATSHLDDAVVRLRATGARAWLDVARTNLVEALQARGRPVDRGSTARLAAAGTPASATAVRARHDLRSNRAS